MPFLPILHSKLNFWGCLVESEIVSRRRIGGIDALATAGVRANRDKIFGVQLCGQDWNDLLQFLEARASEGGGYMRVRESVLLDEVIRVQLERQGF